MLLKIYKYVLYSISFIHLFVYVLGENGHQPPEGQTNKVRILTNIQRQAIYLSLLEKSNNGKLKKDTTKSVALLFSVSMTTVQRIWRRAKESSNKEEVDVSHRRTKNCGRKKLQMDVERFKNIPLSRRTSLRSVACAMDVSKSTLIRWKKRGEIKRHTNPLKPILKDENKRARLQFCMTMLDKETLPHDPSFINMYNVVHIDEKWFYMTKKSETYYLVPEEDEPLRACKSKNFITKVMFLAAIARPRFDEDKNVKFSGKIGIFPFVTKEPAKRSSVNRVAGTLETKAMTSVARDTVRSFLIEKVLKSIREKWPIEDLNKLIFIQQDNAKTHVNPNDEIFCQAATQGGFDIRLMCQPPNSPDFNVLDLGFFRAIQSLQHKESPRNVDELVRAVEKAYEEFSPMKSNHIFLSLQLCMRESMKINGCNHYKIPHINKTTLERQSRLPGQIKCDQKLVEEVAAQLI